MTGDGGPAKDAGLGVVAALAAAPDGSLLIASYERRLRHRGDPPRQRRTARRSRRSRATRTAAGAAGRRQARARGAHRRGQRHDRRARRHDLLDRALQPATNNWKGRLRKLAPDGIVTTVAGGGDKLAENGNPASEVALGSDPKGVALGPDGSIYLALAYEKKVIRIDPSGAHLPLRGQGRRGRARHDRDRRPGERVLHRLAVTRRRGHRRHRLHPLDRQRRQPVARR